MHKNIFIILFSSAVFAVLIRTENVRQKKNYLKNFHNNYEDHAQNRAEFLNTSEDAAILKSVNRKIRHIYNENNRKLTKLNRCKRYAQIYYQNYVPTNCYYPRCRSSYCGYCPTLSCRRRCGCASTLPTTIIPPSRTTSAIKECNCDKHGSKIQACDHNSGKCICKAHYEGVKCDRCELGYYKLKNVCTPCNCNLNGSITLNCNQENGVCQCKVGVQGQKCDSCEDKHYGNVSTGCKACDLCEIQGHICHPKNGKCVCPNLTTGQKCEMCVPNSWGHEPGIGCKPCGCSNAGSSRMQCDAVSGRCTCKLGYEGEKCDKCSFGYYNYPNCQKCKCNLAGTVPEDCERGICKCSEKGCKCKLNVEGLQCNRCKKGTFGMDLDHPAGCIPCFCSNRSNTCTASTYKWARIRVNDIKKMSSLECVNRKTCWKITETFTGDLMQSYGGILTISTNSTKNFVYLIGNDIMLESITDVRGDIKLSETFWKLKYKPNHIQLPNECVWKELTRSCFMVVLQNISMIQIEPNSSNSNINEVLLDRKSQMQAGMVQAKSVESCTCPKEYTSLSCEDPNVGYFRYRPTIESQYNYIDKLLGVAKPCQCHNKSNNCDKETGHCLNCKDYTEGPHCNLCAEGFYKDYERDNCSPCLCPSADQNFASSCTISTNNKSQHKQFICVCKAGYSGIKCDQCDDKFWGDPQRPRGSCQACNCNPYGSKDLRCDKLTGKCLCKADFSGDKCSKCSSPRNIIENGICIPCDECTQILFHTLDDLSNGIDEALNLFKNGLGPPWSLLNSTIRRYEFLKNRLNNIQSAQKLLNNANIPQIESKIANMKKSLILKEDTLKEQSHQIMEFENESKTLSNSVDNLNENINSLIQNINRFGISHVNVHEALREAKQLFGDILEISEETPNINFYQDFFMKCHNLTNHIENLYKNGLNRSNKTKADLMELKDRLMELNRELNLVETTTNLIVTKNKRNAKRIKDVEKKILDINGNHSKINENIVNYLKKINATNALLQDLKSIHRTLSTLNIEDATAELNQDDIFEIYEFLPNIEQHVTLLQEKLKTFNKTFKFTPEEWTKIDASGAYQAIVSGIQSAKNAADGARNATVEALERLYPHNDDSLPVKTNLARAFSDRIEKRVLNLKNLTIDFKKTTDKLEDLKDNILINGKSNNELNSFLRNILKDIKNLSSNIGKLNRAENNARNVSSLITSIEQKLKDTNITMQYELTKSYERYLKLLSGPEMVDLSKKINETKKQLRNKNIGINLEAIDKMKDANRTKFNNNETLIEMKNQIENLKNLIQYANDMVDVVDYGFNLKTCQRHYQLQSDILRTIEIHFKCEICSLFNLSNSNNQRIELSYKDGKVVVKWRNQSTNLIANSSISITKIGSRIEISTDRVTGRPKTLIDKEPFEIENKHYLQVGEISEVNGTSEACLRKIKINGRTIGLWKFHNSKGNCLACNRFDGPNNDGLVNVFLNGNGYRQVQEADIQKIIPTKFSFQFSFATFDENSLLFLARETSNKVNSFIALNLKDGHLQMTVKHNTADDPVVITSDKKYNNGRDTKAVFLMNYLESNKTQNYSLQVVFPPGDEKYILKPLARGNVYRIRKSEIYVGGVPSTFNPKGIFINTTSFMGNLNASEEWKSIVVKNQNSMSANIERKLEKLEFSKAWFPGNGNLQFVVIHNTDTFKNFEFVIRAVNVSNNFVMNINNKLEIVLRNSNLLFKQYQTEVMIGIAANSYCYISLNQSGIVVDGIYKQFHLANDTFRQNKTTFYLGQQKGNYDSFVGSIGDFIIDGSAITYNSDTVKEFRNVEIGRDRVLLKIENVKEMQNTERYLNIPDYKTEPQAFKFGDKPDSFVLIKNNAVGKKFLLEFQFRTFYPNGLLFIANPQFNNKTYPFFVILEIQSGDIRLNVHGHKSKIMNINQRINDGNWHHVHVEQILGKKKWRLVIKVDKKWKLKERIPRSSFNGDLYLGGVPQVQKKIKNELNPFRGCIRSLKINKNAQVVRNNNNVLYSNIGQCFQNVEEGAYFGGDAFAIYKYAFKVNKFLELSFEFKTNEPNGILLSVSNSSNSPALSVELQNGAVVMTIDMGSGIISQVTNSPRADTTLANNEWHNITALYSSSELTVNVDGVRKSWVQSDINSMMDEIEAPLYVGGLPTNAPSGTLKIKENFKGCIRKFKIEDNIMDWTDMKKLNNVQLNSCLA